MLPKMLFCESLDTYFMMKIKRIFEGG